MKSILSVTGASDSSQLTTLAAVKAAIGAVDASADGFIDLSIDRQSDAAAAWCDRVFAKQTYSEIFRGVACSEFLSLRHWPIQAIASITADGIVLDAEDYEFEASTESGAVYRLSSDARIVWDAAKIVVAYTAGYVLPGQTLVGDSPSGARSLPHAVEAAVIQLVKMDYFGRDRDPLLRSLTTPGVQSEDFAIRGASGGMDGSMPGDVAALLAPYRRPMIG